MYILRLGLFYPVTATTGFLSVNSPELRLGLGLGVGLALGLIRVN